MTIGQSMRLHVIFTRIVIVSCILFLFYPAMVIYRFLTLGSPVLVSPTDVFGVRFLMYFFLWIGSFFVINSSKFRLNQDGLVRYEITYKGSFKKSFPSRLTFLLLMWPLFLWCVLWNFAVRLRYANGGFFVYNTYFDANNPNQSEFSKYFQLEI